MRLSVAGTANVLSPARISSEAQRPSATHARLQARKTLRRLSAVALQEAAEPLLAAHVRRGDHLVVERGEPKRNHALPLAHETSRGPSAVALQEAAEPLLAAHV